MTELTAGWIRRPDSWAVPPPPRHAERGGPVEFGSNQVLVEFRQLGDFGVQILVCGVHLRDVRRASPKEVCGYVPGVDLEQPAKDDLEVRQLVVKCVLLALKPPRIGGSLYLK